MYGKEIDLTEEERKKLIKELNEEERIELYDKRDKAMLILLLSHELDMEELTRLNIEHVTNNTLQVGNKTIQLREAAKEALFEYMISRIRKEEKMYLYDLAKRELKTDIPLFTGFRSDRVSIDLVKMLLEGEIGLKVRD
jgi:integrase